jgi:hypothetical protein
MRIVGLWRNEYDAEATMLNTIPANRTQIWLARTAVAALILLFILLKTVGYGSVTSVTRGDVTTYSAPPFISIFSGSLGILTLVAAVVYWMRQGWFYRAVSVSLFMISIYVLFNAPTGINHRVMVTPDYFFDRRGSWYSPVETRVDFKSIVYIGIGERLRSKNKRKTYELICLRKGGGDAIRIPIYDMMKEAVPEILKRASENNISIVPRPEGGTIPSDL